MRLKCWAAILVVGCLLMGYSVVGATQQTSQEAMTPMDTIKEKIDQIVAVLNDPEYSTAAQKKAQRDKIWKISYPMFDFQEISRRAVGPKWSDFSDSEKEKFSDVFAQFLANTYIDRMQGEYHNEKVVYVNELVKEPLALVRTQLMRESVAFPIDYRLRKADDQWKIYDILVENGVSLVKNYRVQFQSILQKETPAQLIERLELKLKEQQTNR